MTETQCWELRQGSTVLGHLELQGVNQPRFECRFRPTAEFEPLRPLFAEELRLLEAGAMEEWEASYARIDELGLSLHTASGDAVIADFLLHVDGDEAWFRY